MNLLNLATAMDNFALSMSAAADSMGHFTCAETDDILSVLVLAGHVEAAERVLWGHMGSEEDGDRHMFIRTELETGSNIIAEQMCAAYVKDLSA